VINSWLRVASQSLSQTLSSSESQDFSSGHIVLGALGVVNFGGTFLLNPRWQLDAAAAVGVTDQAPDVGFTLGLSGLFPR